MNYQKGAAAAFKTPRKEAYEMNAKMEEGSASGMAKVMEDMAEATRSSMSKILHLSALVGKPVKGVAVSNLFAELGTIQEQVEGWEDRCAAVEQQITFLQNPHPTDVPVTRAEFNTIKYRVSSVFTVLLKKKEELGKTVTELGNMILKVYT